MLFTSPFCFSAEIFVFIFYFSVFVFNVLIFTSLFSLSVFFFTFPFLFLTFWFLPIYFVSLVSFASTSLLSFFFFHICLKFLFSVFVFAFKLYNENQNQNLIRIAERRFLSGMPRGYFFFWGEVAALHTQATIKPCRRPLRDIESHVRLNHKLIQNIVPFWKTFVKINE